MVDGRGRKGENRFKEWMGKGKGNAVNTQPKTWHTKVNMNFLFTGLWVGCSSAGLSWALLYFLYSHSASQDKEVATVWGFIYKGVEA